MSFVYTFVYFPALSAEFQSSRVRTRGLCDRMLQGALCLPHYASRV